MTRALRWGCGIAAAIAIGWMALFVGLLAIAMDAVSSAEATTRKRSGHHSYSRRELRSPHTDSGLVTVQGAPFPPLPEEVVRASIDLYGRLIKPLRRFGDTPALGRGCAFLATLHAAVDDLEESEQLFREAQRILEKHADAATDLAWVHNNHGLVQLHRGQYADALLSFQAAIRNPETKWRVVSLQNMAGTYFMLGNPAGAERAFLDALDLLRTTGQENTFVHQVVRSNLAVFYEQLGDLDSARTLLETLASEPRLGRGTRIQVLNNLGYLHNARREFAKAEERFVEAEALTSERSPWRAAILTNRTMMHNRAGQLESAQSVGARAHRALLSVYGDDSVPVAAVLTELAFVAMRRDELAEAERLLARASAIFEKQSNQEFLVVSMRAEALVASRLGHEERADLLSRRALDLAKKHFEQILAFGSEPQRLAYLSEMSPFDQLASMGEPDLLADAVLTMKGAVLESLLFERSFARAGSPADQKQLAHINQLKVEILAKIAAGEGGTEALERDLKRAQTALAERLHVRQRKPADVQSVQAKLDPDQVLVEIVRYQRFAANGDVPSYGAVVISKTNRPAWVPLGDAGTIESRIQSVVTRYGGGRGAEPVHPFGDVSVALRDLYEKVWKPIEMVFPEGTGRVLLSPDGATCFLPWAVLLDERERFVAERWELMQIGSGRDLLSDAPRAFGNALLALGDGANDLEYSREEIEALCETALRHGWSVTTLLGGNALERELFRHPRPRILHFATHAGRLQSTLPSAVQTRLSKNPMYSGYILLGGGSRTLEEWTRGSTDPFGVDGILTAEEASTLDLRDTWLTVLSACQSGAGEVRAGEGVIGLRRGFALAGTENLLFSLWSVDDDSGADFMKRFYVHLFGSDDVARVFHETQTAELARWRQLEGIDGAVRRAGGFVLTR